MIRATVLYLLVATLVTAAAAWVLLLVYPGEAGQKAIITSAVIALAIQLVAFILLQLFKGKNVMAGWGLGALLRFGSLGAYALLAKSTLGLDMNTALVSLACFLFLSMLIEPLLVNV
jgi:preprotein translocase subunit SecG